MVAARWRGRAGAARARRAVAIAAALAGAALLASSAAGAAEGSAPLSSSRLARRLSETGLYADAASKRVAAGNLPYAPQYPLWSDGAEKRRWIRLPPGAHVDARDPDAWVFPAGTKLWKEFSFGGRRVETRLMELRADGTWTFAAYAWDAEERDAALAPARGIPDAWPIGGGVRHDVPGVSDCHACHDGRTSPVLGFTRLQLSPDRDPLAPHAEPAGPGSVDLASLVRRGLVRGGPAGDVRAPPRVPARTAVARAALGYLAANCGTCHTAQGPLAAKGLALDVVAGARREEDLPAHRTAVGVTSRFRAPGDGALPRVAPGDPEGSVLARRMAAADPNVRMPPLGTKLVDEEALALVRRWIREGADAGAADAGAPGRGGGGAAATPAQEERR